jgi:hypothetical protein
MKRPTYRPVSDPSFGTLYRTSDGSTFTTEADAQLHADPEPRHNIAERLDYLRGEIEAERISYGEIAELESLADHIDPSDVVLLQWAGVPEFPDEPSNG